MKSTKAEIIKSEIKNEAQAEANLVSNPNDSIDFKFSSEINEYMFSDEKNSDRAYFIGEGTTQGIKLSKKDQNYMSIKFNMDTLKSLIKLENKIRKVLKTDSIDAKFEWIQNRQITFFGTTPTIVNVVGEKIDKIEGEVDIKFKICLEKIYQKQTKLIKGVKEPEKMFNLNSTLVVVKVLKELENSDKYDISI